jgi:hypothetical protein
MISIVLNISAVVVILFISVTLFDWLNMPLAVLNPSVVVVDAVVVIFLGIF